MIMNIVAFLLPLHSILFGVCIYIVTQNMKSLDKLKLEMIDLRIEVALLEQGVERLKNEEVR